MTHDYCTCGADRVSCIDCAEAEIDRLTAQLAEANNKLVVYERAAECDRENMFDLKTQLAELDGAITCYNEVLAELREENAALREEVERLKERLEANAAKIDDDDVVIEWSDYIKLKEEACKQVAREVEKHLLGMHWTIPYRETEAMIDRDEAIFWVRQRYGLEG